MKTIPMIFNTDMVKALVNGLKTVTRRPFKLPEGWELRDRELSQFTKGHPKKGKWGAVIRRESFPNKYQHDLVPAPCFVGDLLYVRETFCVGRVDEIDAEHPADRHLYVSQCQGDNQNLPKQWLMEEGICIDEVVFTPSIHMPRKASRLTLKVTDVRIETMKELRQDHEQVSREGFGSFPQFRHTWREIYGQCEPGDLVWVIEFEVIHQNIDTYLKQVA